MFVTAARAFLEIDFPQVLNRGLHLYSEVPYCSEWSKLTKIWGAQKQTKNTPAERLYFKYRQLHLLTGNYCRRTNLTDSSDWGAQGRRVYQTVVVGNEKRLARCFLGIRSS